MILKVALGRAEGLPDAYGEIRCAIRRTAEHVNRGRLSFHRVSQHGCQHKGCGRGQERNGRRL